MCTYQGKNPVNATHDRFFSNKCMYVREYTNSISFVVLLTFYGTKYCVTILKKIPVQSKRTTQTWLEHLYESHLKTSRMAHEPTQSTAAPKKKTFLDCVAKSTPALGLGGKKCRPSVLSALLQSYISVDPPIPGCGISKHFFLKHAGAYISFHW